MINPQPPRARKEGALVNRDFVDALVGQWEAELPNVDFLPLSIFARLARYTRLSGRTVYENVGRFSLNETQFNMLAALHRVGEPYCLTPKELSTSMLLTSGAMTYVIDQMESTGNVERLSDMQDRRSSHIRLTSQGKSLIEDAIRAHLRVCAELLSPLSERKQRQLTGLLRELLLVVDEEQEAKLRQPAGTRKAS